MAIIGSPRKGHSYGIVQQIERRLMRNPDLQFEYVFLSQLNLQACRGCYACQSRGEQFCPLKDDLVKLVKRMQDADGVIIVSAAYTGNVSGLMKNLMDRLAYTAHRPAFLRKPAMLVATASSNTRHTLKALAWFSYTGFDIVSQLGIAVWPSPERAWQGGDEKLEKAVRRFENAIKRGSVSLPLRNVLYFNIMKASAATDPTFFQADYRYYEELDTLKYSVSWWKKGLGRLCYWIAVKWLDSRLAPISEGKDRSVQF
jgi:multimeric flavodoxin WrbA